MEGQCSSGMTHPSIEGRSELGQDSIGPIRRPRESHHFTPLSTPRVRCTTCTKSFSSSTLSVHQEDCWGHHLPCPYEDCASLLDSAAMEDHLVNQHGENSLVMTKKYRLRICLSRQGFGTGQMIKAFGKTFYAYFLRRDDRLVCLVMILGTRWGSVFFKATIHMVGENAAHVVSDEGPVKSLLEKELLYETGSYTCAFGMERLMRMALCRDQEAYVYAHVNIQPIFWR